MTCPEPTLSICIQCKIKIIDTGWRPEKFHAFCTECEVKMKAEANEQTKEDIRTFDNDRLRDCR